MNRYEYYQELKALARNIREKHQVNGVRVLPNDIKKICKSEGVLYIDLWDGLKKANGAYFYDNEMGASIVIKRGLPRDPKAFTLAHELKHHLKDQDNLIACCSDNSTKEIEVGAEIFAAEFLFPDELFQNKLINHGADIGNCTPTQIVHLKKQTDTTLSYAGLVKKAEYHGFIERGQFSKVRWKKLEETIYGEPIYKKIRRN